MGVTLIISLLAAVLGACIALGIYRGYLNRIQKQQIAWERAHESQQQDWERKQTKQLTQLEAQLNQQLQQLQQAWNTWEAGDKQRLEDLQNRHAAIEAQMHMQSELAHLPRIEEAPVSPLTDPLQPLPASWRPPQLQASKLSGRDLSHRYMAHADLRNAELAHANFFMADLGGAVLTGAQLEGADLSGANLTGADLRGSNLKGANLLVADLRAAILFGANLLGARNLTPEQINTAVYDHTTQLDPLFASGGPQGKPVEAGAARGTDETRKIPVVASSEKTNGLLAAAPPVTPYPEDLKREEAQPGVEASQAAGPPGESRPEAFDAAPPRPDYNGTP